MSLVSFNVDPSYEFKNELLCIQNPFYLKLVVQALNKVPSYFWFVPASSSGKYHPKSSLGMGGLVRHVRSVFWISEELLSHSLYAPFTDIEKDEIRVAILLHDACKQGIQDEPSHTLMEHPLLVRNALHPMKGMEEHDDYSEEDLHIATAWSRICDLIETHMGIWTKDKEGNEILDIPKTKAQLFVHQCDFLASRSIIEVDTTKREAQGGYRKNDSGKDDWKSQPATDKQVEYLRKLYVMANEKGVYYPPIQITDAKGNMILTKGIAGDTIEALKDLIGI